MQDSADEEQSKPAPPASLWSRAGATLQTAAAYVSRRHQGAQYAVAPATDDDAPLLMSAIDDELHAI